MITIRRVQDCSCASCGQKNGHDNYEIEFSGGGKNIICHTCLTALTSFINHAASQKFKSLSLDL
jgi:hypothetical protein